MLPVVVTFPSKSSVPLPFEADIGGAKVHAVDVSAASWVLKLKFESVTVFELLSV